MFFTKIKAIFFLCLLFTANISFGHSGGLNNDGCHNNRKTGGYHCHKSQSSGYNTPTPNYNRSQPFTCGTKFYCNQMSSCSEANYYMHTCRLYKLDGDGDGIPCEQICE